MTTFYNKTLRDFPKRGTGELPPRVTAEVRKIEREVREELTKGRPWYLWEDRDG